MTRRTVRLVERRTREVALARADAAFLLAHARAVVDVQPAFTPGRYRLTPRGFVGYLDTPTLRLDIRPKVAWPGLLLLLGVGDGRIPAGDDVPPAGGLLAALGGELAARLRDVVQAGLVRGYHDEARESPFLRGRLNVADQLRDAAARAFPDHFHVTESVFDLDTPWNRVPRAVAADLLARPELPSGVRSELAAAVAPLDAVPLRPPADADFDAAAREPRAAAYNPLLALCRLIRDGFAAADPTGSGNGAFLLDLGRAFERYLTRAVERTLAARPGWSVDPQPRFVLGAARGEPAVLQPDVLVRRRGAAWAVLDAKWKRPGPDAADLHQILAYAAVTGADRVGLVYPGRRFAARRFAPTGRLRLTLFRVPVAGPAGDFAARVLRAMGRP